MISARSVSGRNERVTDPLSLRVDIFARRRRLHAYRRYLRTLAAARGIDEPPSRPIFVIGCPRSGTTLLFRLLKCHGSLRGLHGEGHVLWSAYQHPRDKNWSSDRATAADIRSGEARYLYTGIAEIAGTRRFLDKTPRNSLKVSYLASLFPDATFVLLARDGPATVSSLIEGWKLRHGVSYRLPLELRLAEYRGRYWSYVLPSGWRYRVNTSIAEVAALQYVSSYETALDDLASIRSDRVVLIRFEDLLRDPVPEITRLSGRLELAPSEPMIDMASHLESHPVQTTSPPRPGKWRDRAEEIAGIRDLIAPTMERLGYGTDFGS